VLEKQAKRKQVVQAVKGPWLQKLAKILLVGFTHLHAKIEKYTRSSVFYQELVASYLMHTTIEGDSRRQRYR
jgi:hypothetical protein